MTQQEQQMIAGLMERVQNTPLTGKDPEAEQYLQQGLGHNPDALYILAQTILVQGYALEQAQKQLADMKSQLQQQTQQPQKHTSFLGSIFGSGEPNRPAAPPPQPTYTPVPTYTQSGAYAQPVSYQPATPSGGGGFLRGAMQTAAGVAAGAVAFEGIESLMHGFGGHDGGSGFGGFGGDAPREEVVNNYYGGDSANKHNDRSLLGNDDIEDRRDDSSSSQSDFADAQDNGENDASADDFSSNDDSDDFSGGDDSNFS